MEKVWILESCLTWKALGVSDFPSASILKEDEIVILCPPEKYLKSSKKLLEKSHIKFFRFKKFIERDKGLLRHYLSAPLVYKLRGDENTVYLGNLKRLTIGDENGRLETIMVELFGMKRNFKTIQYRDIDKIWVIK
jgi:hypothetical protein